MDDASQRPMSAKDLALGAYRLSYKVLVGRRIVHSRVARKVHALILSRLESGRPSGSVQIQGHTMFLDRNDSLQLYATGIYEPIETEIVKREVRSGEVVLDIGAHIGYYTLLFARLVGESGRVFAFEPDPANFAILSSNVAVNAYENVTLIRSA